MKRPTTPVAVLLGLAGLCVAALGGGWIVRAVTPDAVLAHGFGLALADADVSWSRPAPHVWLSNFDGAGPTSGKALSLGDTITIAGKNGHPERIEVTGLEQVDGDRLGLPGLQFQLVTGQFEAPAAGSTTGQLARFLFAVDAPAAVAPASNRSL